MFKPTTLDPDVVNDFLQKNDYAALTEYLKDNFVIQKDPEGAPINYEFTEETVLSLHQVLNATTEKSVKIELFRALRNYAINPETRDYIINHSSFLNDIKLGNDANLHKVIFQFFINLTVKSKDACVKLFDLFLNDILKALPDTVYEASALLYNISLYQPLDCLGPTLYFKVLELIELYAFGDLVDVSLTEYLYFLIEKFLCYSDFWPYYPEFSINQRIAILQTIRKLQVNGDKLNMPETGLEVLAERFVKSSNVIFQTVSSSSEDLTTYEPAILLEILVSLCGEEEYLKVLQNNANLLIHTGVMLINLHKLGQDSENCFSKLEELSELSHPNEELVKHPVFGFKAGLIAIIGNMSWKNKRNQDLVREAELIPVIMDCSSLDARNPLIQNYVILATRNLLENNLKNQVIIASLTKIGKVDSRLLEEVGLAVHKEGGDSITMVPLDVLKRHQSKS